MKLLNRIKRWLGFSIKDIDINSLVDGERFYNYGKSKKTSGFSRLKFEKEDFEVFLEKNGLGSTGSKTMDIYIYGKTKAILSDASLYTEFTQYCKTTIISIDSIFSFHEIVNGFLREKGLYYTNRYAR